MRWMTVNANSANKTLVLYASSSGNTKEVAELLALELRRKRVPHDVCRVGVDDAPDLSQYALVIIGSYSVGTDGRVPGLLKRFIRGTDHYKPENVAVFGTGDTQWQFFCGAAMRLAKYYNSDYPVLKIEQSPRNGQESLITNWISEVLTHEKVKQV